MPRVKKPGAYHHGDLRRTLLDAAVRVVEREGVAALSLHALARKAGVSSGAPYHHFASREELLAAIAVEGFERLVACLKQCALEAESTARRGVESPAEARFRALGEGYVRFALANPGYFRIMFRPELKRRLKKERDAAVDEAFVLLEQAIVRCQEEGSVPQGDPRRLILLAWASVHGASVLWLDGPLSDEGLVEGAEALGPQVAGTLTELFRRGRELSP